MKGFRFLLFLLLIASAAFSQQNTSRKPGGSVSPEAFYKMQLAVEDQGFIVNPDELIVLMEETVKQGADGKLDTLSVIRIHARCRELMYYALREKKKEMAEVKTVFTALDKILDEYLHCDQHHAYYKEIFLKDSASLKTMETVVRGLEQCNCQGVDLYMKVAKRYYDKDSTPEKALLLAKYFLKKNGYGFALPLLQKAAMSKDSIIAAQANFEIAACYRFYNRLKEAVEFSNKALQLKPSLGMAYVIIGDAYFLGAAACGKNDIEKMGPLWAAYDQYQKGLKNDPSLRNIVRLRMAVLNRRFPTTEALKANKLIDKAPYKVGCWINETTQVRARKAD
ncbi:MAG: hypothetical protein AB9842_05155 [Bacteroidales bacterium]